jgi:hypothetical protein
MRSPCIIRPKGRLTRRPFVRSIIKSALCVFLMVREFKILILMLLLMASMWGCRSHKVGEVHVEGEGKPHFRFVGLNVGRLVIFEVPQPYLKDGIPLDELKDDNPNTQWFLEGSHKASEPIIYGSVPSGMKEFAPAKPLAEGVIYFASSYVGTEDTGAFVGQYFKIKNGRAEEFHEESNQ